MQQTLSQDSIDFPLGAHLVTPRRWYMHHGIYVGAGQVVHYQGLSSSLRHMSVAKVSLAEFARGNPVRVHSPAGAAYSGVEVVVRACSRLDENSYDILRNNCEHFCSWCLSGAARSRQVECLSSSFRIAAASLQAVLGLVNVWLT